MSESGQERRQVAVSAIFVALGTVTSRGLGFLREMVVYHYFDRTATDVWNVAFRLPNLFRRLFGEGAMTVSFIPVLTDFIKSDDKQGARELISAVFTLLFVVLSILTFIGTFYAAPFVTALTNGQGFISVPGKIELTIHQAQIMFCYIMLVSFYAYVMGILNTLRIFWLPAVAPALWNLAMIVGAFFFRSTFKISSDILAWSTVVGGVLQLAILIPSLKRVGFMPRFRKWWGNPAVKKVLRAMGPSILGLSVLQIGVLINTHFASQLEEGSNSWIYLADRLLEFPLSLFAVSVGTAALPTLAAFWSRGDKEGMSEASLHALKLSLFMAIPCAAGIFVLAEPIMHTLFEHGKFSSHDTFMTSSILRIYGMGVIFATGVRVLAPAFYAMKNTKLPAIAAAVALTCHVCMAGFLMKLWGVVGLATSSVLSGGINFLFLMISYQFKIAHLKFSKLVLSVGKFVIASFALIAVCQLRFPIENFFGDSHFGRSASLGAVIFLGGVAYLGCSALLKTPELTETLGELQKRIRAKFRSKKSL